MTRYDPTPDEIPSGFCECGCGGRTTIARATYRSRRHFRGHPTPRLPGHGQQQRGPGNANWKGGRIRHHTGYILVRAPEHPQADPKGYAREHRLVMEQHLGRYLLRTELVHHINGVKDDNRIENLVVMTKAEHNSDHAPERQYDSDKMRQAGYKGHAARWGYERPA